MSFGENLTVKRGPRRDGDNNLVAQIGGPISLTGCVVEPIARTELIQRGRSGTTTGIRVYFTGVPAAPITARDVLVRNGLDYQIVGNPSDWTDPEGDPDFSGLVIEAERAEG